MVPETSVLRRTDFSSVLSLLMPAFAFHAPPRFLAKPASTAHECSPTNNKLFLSFGGRFDARLFSARERSTGELLRTL